MAERADLVAAIALALDAWEQWRKGKTLLTEWPPIEEVYEPITDAISGLDAYKAVEGQSLFSGYSGVVLFPDRLAIEVLRHAERMPDKKAERGAGWLLHVLSTRDASGFFFAPIWGLKIDKEVQIADGVRLVPFDAVPNSYMKERITDRAKEQWNKTMWQSQSYFDLPAAAIVRHLDAIRYIGSPEIPFEQIESVQIETTDQLAFLQASATGAPLVARSWFEWEDASLDFNRFENWAIWHLPEILPRVMKHVPVKGEDIAGAVGKFTGLPSAWQKTLMRSMNRFVLSQCRHKIPDQALDLALAFEVAVGGGSGDHSPASWKVSVRSAQLIGGSLQDRLAIRETLSELYAVRSKAAHGGDMKRADEGDAARTIAASNEIYQRMLESILGLGELPDWKSLELQSRG